MSNWQRYFHTVRYLKPMQIYGRLWFKYNHPEPDLRSAPQLNQPSGRWVSPLDKCQSMIDEDTFQFLNQVHALKSPDDWNHPDWPHLWLYNLHYFDDLQAYNAVTRLDWHHALIDKWIADNPPVGGVGWEPYPISRRIVNWIKWSHGSGSLSSSAYDSLAVQARYLSRRIERHLLGNHLLANLKALFFADCVFSKDWRTTGDRTNYGVAFCRELNEQLDCNGAHCEMSPMYHALVLEDVLDIMNISRNHNENDVSDMLVEPAAKMLKWLTALTHPDGQIALFNDAATDSFLTAASLTAYANHLGLPTVTAEDETGWFPQEGTTGYVRWQDNSAVALLDYAPIGPDYLPAHGHADYLTFELSIGQRRIVVDTGTSHYANDDERLVQRGTLAHNTPVIDGHNSADVWSSFRVGRRAKIKTTCKRESDSITVEGWHDGYRHLGVSSVRRVWRMSPGLIFITDHIGTEKDRGRVHGIDIPFHLNPELTPTIIDEGVVEVYFEDTHLCSFEFQQPSAIQLADYDYHPEFGVSIPGQKIICHWQGPLPVKLVTRISWDNNAHSIFY